MASSTLNQAVHPGDLILAYSYKGSFMLLAETGSDEPNPPTSAIMVDTPDWSACADFGYWTLSGPDVYYTKTEEEEEEDQSGSETTLTEDTPKPGGVPLDEFLQTLREGEEREVSIIVNPHEREVLKNHFGVCPFCDGGSFICPGCGGISSVFPEIFGGCGVYLSCPVCMGLDFSIHDNGYIRELESLECKLYFHKHSISLKEPLGAEEVAQLEEEGKTLARERYEVCNGMLREMGLKEYDIEKEVKDWQEAFC